MTKGWKSVKNANKHCDLIICPIAATSLNKQLESRCCSSHMMTNREPYSLEALCLVLQFDMFGKSQRKQLHMSCISAASELSRVKYAFQVVNDVRIECLQQPDLQGNMDCSQQWDNTLLAQWMHWFFSCSATDCKKLRQPTGHSKVESPASPTSMWPLSISRQLHRSPGGKQPVSKQLCSVSVWLQSFSDWWRFANNCHWIYKRSLQPWAQLISNGLNLTSCQLVFYFL